jgi:hypothetical protein
MTVTYADALISALDDSREFAEWRALDNTDELERIDS